MLANQLLIIKKQNDIMSAIDDLKASLANEDTAISGLITAFNNLNTQLKNLPPDDSAALAAFKSDVDAQTTAINAALNPPVVTTPPSTTGN